MEGSPFPRPSPGGHAEVVSLHGSNLTNRREATGDVQTWRNSLSSYRRETEVVKSVRYENHSLASRCGGDFPPDAAVISSAEQEVFCHGPSAPLFCKEGIPVSQCETRIVLRLGGCSTFSRGTLGTVAHSLAERCSVIILAFLPDAESPAIQNGPNYDDHYADVEKKEYSEDVPANDPFGNEEEGEVKYRVMGWW
ncbi:unnamed protein product [Aspergillus oryzae]|uniref:Unnamed protein product n=2 Tax=Aspergillus oryzae TaxID=5062 RepID=A0AAN5BTY2_ASPOZ|nr:unnamed protein product [Aspergillus oryzae]GMF93634.1 unnamed protein product [Aspergillus oryzae]GMG08836.1 unnamed protein product [Aspergillus oryzae]GMG24720.1 unnamed protein product [Aspergillus oryzae]GMG50358.1 unnamed protein product [Aspergillus oryzae var. brunneus]